MLHLQTVPRLTRPAAVSKRSSAACSSSSSNRANLHAHAPHGAAAAAALAAVVLQLSPLSSTPVSAADTIPAPATTAAAATNSSYSSTEAIKQAVERDFVTGQYYVTGQLTPALYEPDCLFTDPTTKVKGVEPYTSAVKALFDPAASKADLISIAVTDPHSITLRWRLEGKLQLGGGLPIKPYTGTTVYHIDEAGLIDRHEETWDISALDAFVSTFVPSFGAPPAPPVS